MAERTDQELLAEFARSESEQAFAALVARYVNLVYSTALRFTSNAHSAEEITQAVFIILARKAGALSTRVVLSGWLYQTARLTAANFVKGEMRRQRREQEAYMQSTLNEPGTGSWEQIAPLLDDAMGRLGETDRDAVVLRFFENKTAAEVGAALQLSEAAAHKRTSRALEKLRRFFARHGVSSTTTIISGLISVHSVRVAPGAVAKSVTAAAVAKGAISASTLTLIQGALKVMAWTKAKTAMVAGVVVLFAAGTTTITLKIIRHYQNNDAAWDIGQIDSRILRTGPHIVRVIPTKFPKQNGWAAIDNGRILGLGNTAKGIIMAAYGGSATRTVFATVLPGDKYDFIANLPTGSEQAFQEAVRKQFRIVARRETIETNVLFLRVKAPNAPGLKPPKTPDAPSSSRNYRGRYTLVNMQFESVGNFLEGSLSEPVIDQTGIKGSYDMDLKWNYRNDPGHNNLRQAVAEQLGLELVPGSAPLDMLVIEKAK